MTTGPEFIVSYFYFVIYWGDLPKVGRFFSSHFSNPPLISSFALCTTQPRTDLTQASWPGCHWILRWVRSLGSWLCFFVCAVEQDSPFSGLSTLSYFLSLETKILTEPHFSEEEGFHISDFLSELVILSILTIPRCSDWSIWHISMILCELPTEILTIWHTDVNDDNAQKHVVAPGLMYLCDNIQAHKMTTDSNTLHTFSSISVVFNSFWRKQHFKFEFTMLTMASTVCV